MRKAFLLNVDPNGIEVGGRYMFGSCTIVSSSYVALESLLLQGDAWFGRLSDDQCMQDSQGRGREERYLPNS